MDIFIEKSGFSYQPTFSKGYLRDKDKYAKSYIIINLNYC